MTSQTYLIDTNIIFGLEDNHAVDPAFATFQRLATRHRATIYVHEAAQDDIKRDKNSARKSVSLSKLSKFQHLSKVRGLAKSQLESKFGPLKKSNDVVDATLLHALDIGAADFLVTEDQLLHRRALRYAPELSDRVLYVTDAVELLRTTFEPKEPAIRYVEEVSAHEIPKYDPIFDSLKIDYPEFDTWWRNKCVREHRPCWIVDDGRIAGLLVRKDETRTETDALTPANKILKICTFKVSPEKRGIKLGELLLKKVFWFAQTNAYDLVYLTTFPRQRSLIDLLEFYGFSQTGIQMNGEIIYEKPFSQHRLERRDGEDVFLTDRRNYPRFVTAPSIRAFGIPIREAYHDTLYPDLRETRQMDLFDPKGLGTGPIKPGNTIRKVYLCRASSSLGPPGSLLFFYKGKSNDPPSQAMTAVGVLEKVTMAKSVTDLLRLTVGRSVYSENELLEWGASTSHPVKVIDYLLSGYIRPPVSIVQLKHSGVFSGQPPQSIFEIKSDKLAFLLDCLNLGFDR